MTIYGFNYIIIFFAKSSQANAVSTHILQKISVFFSKTFLGISKMDKKNVQISFSEKSFRKILNLDHNEKLASGRKKHFFKIVTIKFLYFSKMNLDIFVYGYIMDTLKEQKEQLFFFCDLCDFKCCKKYNFERHQSTDKHKWIHNVSKMDTKKRAKEQHEKYYCECGKEYK
jgi:hypothetical protein